MVLGENVGTTITANLAAIVANTTAKRAAFCHFLFNFIGVIWAMALLNPVLKAVDFIVVKAGDSSPFLDVASIPVALSVFHTSFNVINTILLAGFMKQLEKLSVWIIRSKKGSKEQYRLKHFKTGLLSISELSLLQARKEIAFFAHRTHKMFKTVRELFNETNEEKYKYLLNRVEHYEEIADRIEIEIADYLTKIAEGELSQPGTVKIKAMLKMVDDMESIGDSCQNMAQAIQRKKNEKIWFSQDLRNNLNAMFDLLERAFGIMLKNLENEYKDVDLESATEAEGEINALRNVLKQEHLSNIENKSYKYQAGVVYNDIIAICEQMGDFICNISVAVAETNPPDK